MFFEYTVSSGSVILPPSRSNARSNAGLMSGDRPTLVLPDQLIHKAQR
jgi:hypothetical protein